MPLETLIPNGPMLKFRRQDEEWEFRILGGDAAELIPIFSEEDLQDLKDDDVPLPKPFRVRRIR